jgi:hypothetical protein
VSAAPAFEAPSRRLVSGRPATGRRARHRNQASLLPMVALCLCAGFGCYAVSTLVGESLATKAQRDLARSHLRARDAASRLADAQRRLEAATSPQALTGWATARGMVHPFEGWLALKEGRSGH